ncbi:MAG TPA: ABC transporter ATP-binding protein [Candidatus Dormibacteraeota bacterium]|nr:ABC transporter ATP-binding protein [Candidatus Dormibacteraeota bacterium]
MTQGEKVNQAGRVAPAPAGPIREVEPLALLEVARLSKVYRDPMTLKPFTAVNGLSFTLGRGEIFGLLGPNGAGKTTTIKLILGLAKPTQGLIRLDGRDPRDPAARRRLGYLPENPCFYDHLTATEYLELTCALFGLDARAGRRAGGTLLERLGLAAHARKPLRKYSKGMTQRLGLAQALLNEPTFLVLDEPMSGLDPIGRAEVKQILREERSRGTTILMSSHVLAETESICDRVGIMSGGKLLEVGSVPGLLSTGVREWEIAVESLPERPAAELRAAGHRVESLGTRWLIRVVEGPALQRALKLLTQSEVFIHSVEPRRETLEEHFVRALSSGKGNGS